MCFVFFMFVNWVLEELRSDGIKIRSLGHDEQALSATTCLPQLTDLAFFRCIISRPKMNGAEFARLQSL